MLFLVQVVMFMPAVFLIAGVLFMIFKTINNPVHLGENLSFITIFVIHILIYSGIYYLLSFILAKLICLIQFDKAKKVIVLALCLCIVGITFLPIYGGGGHGPVEWVNLPEYLKSINSSYGSATSAIVYGTVLLLIILKLALDKRSAK